MWLHLLNLSVIGSKNIVEKGENAGFQHFLLFPHYFTDASFSGSLKIVIVWEWVKQYLICRLQLLSIWSNLKFCRVIELYQANSHIIMDPQWLLCQKMERIIRWTHPLTCRILTNSLWNFSLVQNKNSCRRSINPLPYKLILGSSTSAANKDMSKIFLIE